MIEDLDQRSDAEIEARALTAFPKLALWLLRDARDPVRLLASFDGWIPALREVERAPGGFDSFVRLIAYMLRVVDPVRRDDLRAKIRLLGRSAEEVAMSIADQIHEEGRIKGHEEGRIAMLRQLLLHKFQCPALDAAAEVHLATASPEQIDCYPQRVLTADSIAAVLAD